MALLKIIAWADRDHDLRAKDAKDIAYLLEAYQDVDNALDRLYEIDGLMDQYGWDIDFASAHLLGIDVAGIAGDKTKIQISEILNMNLQGEGANYLAEEMCTRLDEEYDNRLRRLEAFSNGFQG